MCTSFVWRMARKNVLVAMNFDYGNAFKLSTTQSEFIILAGGVPCFGVNNNGTFINHLMVDSNGKGDFRRGKNVVHTIQLIRNMLGKGRKVIHDIDKYLSEVEIVNVPNNSCHNMVTDKHGNAWIVEPGRGIIHSPVTDSPYYLMTNFSLCDLKENGKFESNSDDRYKIADKMLSKADNLDVDSAFEILNVVKQIGGEYPTVFSMVYSQEDKTVYYCKNGNFLDIEKHNFNS